MPVTLPAELASLLRGGGDLLGELEPATIGQRARLLATMSGARIRLRSTGAAVGAQGFAHPGLFEELLAAARADLVGEEPHVRVGLVGLVLLLVHPLEDGNGRLARLVWLRGLLGAGHSVREAIGHLSALYVDSGNLALAAFGAAHAGDLSLFRALWQQARSLASAA